MSSSLPCLPLGMSAEVWRQPAGDGQLPHGKPWPGGVDVWWPGQEHIPLATHPNSPATGFPQAPPSLELPSAGSERAELASIRKPHSYSSACQGGGIPLRCSTVSQMGARQWGWGRGNNTNPGLRTVGSQGGGYLRGSFRVPHLAQLTPWPRDDC